MPIRKPATTFAIQDEANLLVRVQVLLIEDLQLGLVVRQFLRADVDLVQVRVAALLTDLLQQTLFLVAISIDLVEVSSVSRP